MSRNVKSLLTLLLVLLLIVGVSVIPLPSEFDSDLSATRNQIETVGVNAN
jgi:hypothetical protein